MTATGSPNAGEGASGSNRKWQAIGLFAFLLTAVVLAIVLGVTLGNSDTSSSANNDNDEYDVGTTKESSQLNVPIRFVAYYLGLN